MNRYSSETMPTEEVSAWWAFTPKSAPAPADRTKAVRTYTLVHFFLYASIGITSCVAVGYVASLILPVRRRDLSGLTIWPSGLDGR